MRIATWNVNSIKQRLEHLPTFLKTAEPDVVCLQELKCIDDAFPRRGRGGRVQRRDARPEGLQRRRHPLEGARSRTCAAGCPGEADEQARYIEGVISTAGGVVRVASIYLPNGNPIGTPKFDYKLAFLDRLAAHAGNSSSSRSRSCSAATST